MARLQRLRMRNNAAVPRHNQRQEVALDAQQRGFTSNSGLRTMIGNAQALLQPGPLRVSAGNDPTEQQADRQAAALSGAPLAAGLRTEGRVEAGGSVPRSISAAIGAARGGGQALPETLARTVDDQSGHDFAHIRVHTDRNADQLSRSLTAQAFTSGRDIFFARGAYQPQSTAGLQLIYHELSHAAGQAPSAAPLIQRKLSITRSSLIAATGDKGAMVWSTSSYEKLLDVLQAYEKLDTADPAGEQADRRSELLLQIMNLAKAWLMSDRRAFNDPTGQVKPRKGDDVKQDMLGNLLVEAQDEYRKYLLGIEKPAKPTVGVGTAKPKTTPAPAAEGDKRTEPAAVEAAVKQEDQQPGPPAAAQPETGAPAAGRPRSGAVTSRAGAGAPPLPTRGRRGAILLSETSASEQAARQHAAEAARVQQGFFARVGASMSKFLHYTFGTDFTRQEGAAAFDPKRTLSPSVIDTLIRLMDQADKTFDELVAAGVKPAVALLLAYQEMPEQLRPKGTDPAARLALNVRKQYMLEAIQPPPARGVAEKVSAANTGVGSLAGIGQTITSAGGSAVSGVGSLMKSGAAKASAVGATLSEGAEHIDAVKSGTNALSGLIGGIRDARDFISSAVAIFKAKDAQDRQIQTNAVLGVGLNLLANLSKLSSNVGKIVATFGSELPGVKLIASALQGLESLINQLKTAVRSLREMSLALEARRKASGLAHILESLSNRNMMLMFRNAIKVITNAIKMIGETLVLVPDPSGTTQAVGKVTSIVASAVEAGATVAAMIEDSYRAGVAQEAAQQAMGGERGADIKVLKGNTAWAVTALILEAKKQLPDPIAVRELGNYGLTPERIARESLELLREFILAEIAESAEPKTITQKLVDVVRSIKGGAEKVAHGVGRAGAKLRDRFS